jgi:glucan phosphoethanolaminetransferase (alkaline phosphatase superfamily)
MKKELAITLYNVFGQYFYGENVKKWNKDKVNYMATFVLLAIFIEMKISRIYKRIKRVTCVLILSPCHRRTIVTYSLIIDFGIIHAIYRTSSVHSTVLLTSNVKTKTFIYKIWTFHYKEKYESALVLNIVALWIKKSY